MTTSPSSIPEAAVEAAAAGIFRHMEDAPWESAGPEEIPFFIASARIALEAAAPHIMATALEEAADRADERELTSITPGALRRRAKSYRPTP